MTLINYVFPLFIAAAVLGSIDQQPITSHSDHETLHVAIVGAGVAGASVAFYARMLSCPSKSFSVTIYEAEDRIGGRVQSLRRKGSLLDNIEAGATQFLESDWCLTTAMESLGLQKEQTSSMELPRTTGVWDGNKLLTSFNCNDESISWWDLTKSAWRHGFPPSLASLAIKTAADSLRTRLYIFRRGDFSLWRFRRAETLLAQKWELFLKPVPFNNVGQQLNVSGLADSVLSSADHYLSQLQVSRGFQDHFVESCTRASSSRDLAELSGLSAMVATRSKRRISVQGGNSRLVEKMINHATADLQLNSQVTQISLGSQRRYRVTSADMSQKESKIKQVEFDVVVVTASIKEASDLFSELNLQRYFISPLYAESHVTHFTTTASVAPSFLGLSSNTTLPNSIFFTKPINLTQPGILHISTSSVCDVSTEGCMAHDDCDAVDCRNLHRVSSRYRLSDTELVKIVGGTPHSGNQLDDYDIGWVHRAAWPRAFPIYKKTQPLPGDIEIAPGLFYLGDAEEVVSSMEMSCRIGRNVAAQAFEETI